MHIYCETDKQRILHILSMRSTLECSGHHCLKSPLCLCCSTSLCCICSTVKPGWNWIKAAKSKVAEPKQWAETGLNSENWAELMNGKYFSAGLSPFLFYFYSSNSQQQLPRGILHCKVKKIQHEKKHQASTQQQWEGKTPVKPEETAGWTKFWEGHQFATTIWWIKRKEEMFSTRKPGQIIQYRKDEVQFNNMT